MAYPTGVWAAGTAWDSSPCRWALFQGPGAHANGQGALEPESRHGLRSGHNPAQQDCYHKLSWNLYPTTQLGPLIIAGFQIACLEMHTDNRCYQIVVMKDDWEWKVIPLFDDSGDALPTLLLLKNATFPSRALPPTLQVFIETPALLPPSATSSLLSILDNCSSSHNGAFLALA